MILIFKEKNFLKQNCSAITIVGVIHILLSSHITKCFLHINFNAILQMPCNMNLTLFHQKAHLN